VALEELLERGPISGACTSEQHFIRFGLHQASMRLESRAGKTRRRRAPSSVRSGNEPSGNAVPAGFGGTSASAAADSPASNAVR
jgi:hypothetical protein